MKYTHDIIIIGGGSAGLVGARFAAELGARVALVERDRIGGDCTWTGCVPSKALVRAAHAAREIRTAGRFGIEATHEPVDLSRVRDFIRSAMDTVYEEERPERLAEQGIEVVPERAEFLDAHSVKAGSRTLTARNFVLSTGARAVVPSIPGLDSVPFLTYHEIFENEHLPQHLLVVGAGPIGLEIARAYRGLGSEVTVVGRAVIPREDAEVADFVAKLFERDGVKLLLTEVESVRRKGSAVTLATTAGDVTGDLLFVATGRRPNLDGLSLDNAGVKHGVAGVPVDKYLRTNVRHIFAAGDVVGGAQFTHLAAWQGFQAVRNALLPGSSRGLPSVLPRVTYLDPEVASVGATEAQARASHGTDVLVHRWRMDQSDRPVCDAETDGFIKVIARKNGTILGVSIVAARAGEMLIEFVVAMEHGLGLSELAATVHPYPTWSSAVQQLASEEAVGRFLSSVSGRIARRLAGL